MKVKAVTTRDYNISAALVGTNPLVLSQPCAIQVYETALELLTTKPLMILKKINKRVVENAKHILTTLLLFATVSY